MKTIKATLQRNLPPKIQAALTTRDEAFFAQLTELRLRADKPLQFRLSGIQDRFDRFSPTQADIADTMKLLADYSLYAFSDETRQGFITTEGGHRVGICGQVAVENGRVTAFANVSSLNFRIAREIKGGAETIVPYVTNPLKSALIISPPARGKTTILRDLVRLVSDGGANAAIVDERGEIAACRQGVPQNDVGVRTDVLSLCPKSTGMEMLLRAMSPQVIAVDELSGREDVKAAYQTISAGVSLFCTAHGNTAAEAARRAGLGGLIKKRLFDRYIILTREGQIGVSKILDSNLKEVYKP